MIYKVRPSVHKDVIEHAIAYGFMVSSSYVEPYFRVETNQPFPEKELTAIGFEVWQ